MKDQVKFDYNERMARAIAKEENPANSFMHLENFQGEINDKPVRYYIESSKIEEVEIAYGIIIKLREGIRTKAIQKKFTVIERKYFKLWEVALRARYNYLVKSRNSKGRYNKNYRAQAKLAANQAQQNTITAFTKVMVDALAKKERSTLQADAEAKLGMRAPKERFLDNTAQAVKEKIEAKVAEGKNIQQALKEIEAETMLPQDSESILDLEMFKTVKEGITEEDFASLLNDTETVAIEPEELKLEEKGELK